MSAFVPPCVHSNGKLSHRLSPTTFNGWATYKDNGDRSLLAQPAWNVYHHHSDSHSYVHVMAEAFAIVGLASAIVQFVDFSTKIIQRLDEFKSRVGEVPQTFRDLKIQLPLLRDTLKRAKAEAEVGLIDADTQRAVLDVVEGCRLQVQRLNEILIKTLPTPADSRWRLGMKAFSSVGQERDVREIIDRIQRYQISLIQHHTAPHSLTLPMRTKPLFTVPFAQDVRFTGRQDELKRIDEQFQTQRRVALTGLGGVGYAFHHRLDEFQSYSHVF
jgi:N-terminal domain on NACHT_NTPase and P-loop NTPases